MKPYTSFIITILLFVFACNRQQEKTNATSLAPKVVATHGYVLPKNSMAKPKVIPAGKSKVVPAGTPTVVYTNINAHPVGNPKVVLAGVPRVCTPGQGSFTLPKTIPAIDSPFIAGFPEVVVAKNAYTKDPNPQSFSSFSKLQGLNNGYIRCLLEDKNGNLWFGTDDGGVSRFDGKSFAHFTKKEGLSDNVVNSILEDRNGNLWFGTDDGGVSKYDGKFFTHFTEKEGLGNNVVNSILEDKNGNLWFGTARGVCKYDPAEDGSGGTFTHFTEKEGFSNNYVRSILEDKNGKLWFGTDGGGVSKYSPFEGGSGGTFTHFTEKQGLGNNIVYSILEDKNGKLWFGTAGGVTKYGLAEGGASETFTCFTEKEGLSNNVVYSILEDKSGNVWFGTKGGGVSKYHPAEDGTGGIFTHFTEKEGLSNNVVYSILEDKSGNLWFGTRGGGVSKYDPAEDGTGGTLTHFTDKEGLSNNLVRPILEDKSGNLWFGTDGGGVNKYDPAEGSTGATFTYFTEKEGLSNNFVRSILEDRSGNFWFGTDGGGVSKYDPAEDGTGGTFTYFTEKEGLSNNHIRSILEDKNGNLWFGTDGGGVSKYDPAESGTFTHFTEKEGLSNNYVRSILEDKNGNLWFGTRGGGVSKYDPAEDGTDGIFTQFTEKEGLSNNVVYSILEDKNGNLWFGTRGGGVSKYDPAEDGTGGTFTHFTEKEGLSNNVVYSILEDKSGNLWFGTSFGLSKLAADYEKKLANQNGISHRNQRKNKETTLFKNFTYEDGFLGIGCNINSIFEDRNGTIWIGSNDRLTAVHVRGEKADTTAPNIQLTGLALFSESLAWQNLEKKKDTSIVLGNGIIINGFHFDGVSKWYGLPENLSLAYNNNYLTFIFVGITTKSPGKVKYQYKLEGIDKNWSALTNRAEASYGNLPHGTYTFKVKAMSSEGYWSKEFLYTFTIRPPWWKTWWAYLFYGLCLITALSFVDRFQRRRVIEKERALSREREFAQAKEIEKAYHKLEQAHETLKSTQAQLIQSEKLASLGELTAGIAHEIQNPLNFVNNFSELSVDLVKEINEEMDKEPFDKGFVKELMGDLTQNQEKINLHGKRAAAIVTGMLQHARIRHPADTKEPTDLNALADEYLRLSYHGLRAKDPTFNAKMVTDFDPAIGKVEVIPQDMGRVLLNLINNAFYAVAQKKSQNFDDYEPAVTVSSRLISPDMVAIRIQDNGTGIPDNVKIKIFQPFFTTKPAGQGTGLGLSLAYDIVTKGHGGTFEVESAEGEGTEFIIKLPK